jgi:hypothetical protein
VVFPRKFAVPTSDAYNRFRDITKVAEKSAELSRAEALTCHNLATIQYPALDPHNLATMVLGTVGAQSARAIAQAAATLNASTAAGTAQQPPRPSGSMASFRGEVILLGGGIAPAEQVRAGIKRCYTAANQSQPKAEQCVHYWAGGQALCPHVGDPDHLKAGSVAHGGDYVAVQGNGAWQDLTQHGGVVPYFNVRADLVKRHKKAAAAAP